MSNEIYYHLMVVDLLNEKATPVLVRNLSLRRESIVENLYRWLFDIFHHLRKLLKVDRFQ